MELSTIQVTNIAYTLKFNETELKGMLDELEMIAHANFGRPLVFLPALRIELRR